MHAIPITVTVELDPCAVRTPAWIDHNFRTLFNAMAQSLLQRPDLYYVNATQTSLTVWVGIPEAKHIEDLSASEKLPALEQQVTELKRQLSDVSARYSALKHQIKMLNWSHNHD